MDYSVRRSHCGLITARLIIDLLRSTVEIFLLKSGATASIDEAVMCAALFVAQAEGKPLTAGKLAAFVGMPRPSVIRKLHSLMSRGFVRQDKDKRWHISLDRQEITRRSRLVLATHIIQIDRAAKELSKMDGLKVAAQIQRK